MEKRENDWVSTWAFPIDEAKAKREGFDRNKIKGSLQATPEYPGCPYCGGKDLVQCGSCEKISCYGGSADTEKKPERKQEKRPGGKPRNEPQNKYEGVSLRCYWCGIMLEEIEIVESFSVRSGGY